MNPRSHALASFNREAQRRIVEAVESLPVRGRITMKRLISGDEVLLLELSYEAGAGTQLHEHDHESVCYVVDGRMKATVGEESWELGPGDTCLHPKGVLHAMEAIEESVVLEMKSPAPELAGFLDVG